jgi:type II secretory pathway component PulC
MRWLAWLLTPVTLAAAVWSGDQLWRAVQDPLPAAVQADPATLDQTLALDLPEPQPPTRWPSLFGTHTPPEPQPPRPPQPEVVAQPMPPAPPLDSLGFALKGVVTSGKSRWAIVSHPTGDRLIRVGDTLAEGVTVTAIEADGVRVDNRGTEALLAFTE